jgi:hypothetical protein
MIKKSLLLLAAVACLGTTAKAQQHNQPHCGTDEYRAELIKQFPNYLKTEQALDLLLRDALSSSSPLFDYRFDSMYNAETSKKLIIPVVFHIVHDYGTENVSDAVVAQAVTEMNQFYNMTNPEISSVVDVFKPYRGKMNLEFRLATKDPRGNPTSGITRHFSYLTIASDYTQNSQAKVDQWAPDRYLNIWVKARLGQPGGSPGEVLAFATLPAGAAQAPYYDGIISGAPFIQDDSKTLEHESGHYFNLYHTWGNKEINTLPCDGNDEVDDTPPTLGQFGCPPYDTTCATGYMKTYNYLDSSGVVKTAVWDYPDTVNVENVMNYAQCKKMFTKQQVLRMRNTLKSSVASRNNLSSASNILLTGVDDGNGNYVKPDLAPVAEFSVEKSAVNTRTVFMCANGHNFKFKNQSWRGANTVNWEFSNGAIPGTSTEKNSTLNVQFSNTGWATVKLKATGTNGKDSTIVNDHAVYVADNNNLIDGANGGYYQEFNQGSGSDVDQWPIFNYYSNAQKWTLNTNAGYYDKTSMMYAGWDARQYPNTLINTPKLDYDDFFTRGFDLSGMAGGNCNLNFMYAGAYRTSNPVWMRDTLEIHYSVDCGDTWKLLKRMTKGEMTTVGTLAMPFAPLSTIDWKGQSLNIPSADRTNKVFFRFRYKPGTDDTYAQFGSGNNFYIDRINISSYTTGINTMLTDERNIILAPNPANNGSYVLIKGVANSEVKVNVTDITGKLVFSTQQKLKAEFDRIEIPASAITVKGFYMVQVVHGSRVHTEKLVSY